MNPIGEHKINIEDSMNVCVIWGFAIGKYAWQRRVVPITLLSARYQVHPCKCHVIIPKLYLQVCSDKNLITTMTVPGNHEEFILGDNARVTASVVSKVLLV